MASITSPKEITRLLMVATSTGCDVRMVGILCAQTNEISIKQVEVPESSKAWDCIEVDPKQRLTFKAKPPDGVMELYEQREVG